MPRYFYYSLPPKYSFVVQRALIPMPSPIGFRAAASSELMFGYSTKFSAFSDPKCALIASSCVSWPDSRTSRRPPNSGLLLMHSQVSIAFPLIADGQIHLLLNWYFAQLIWALAFDFGLPAVQAFEVSDF